MLSGKQEQIRWAIHGNFLEAWAKENVHATAFGDEATARQLAKNCLEAAKRGWKLPEAIFPIFSSPN
jgi:hypothetical protein